MMSAILGVSILLAALAGIVTSLIILWTKVVRPTLRIISRLSKVVDVVLDLPEWCEAVDSTLSELRPNGGGSMKDRVSRIYHMTESHINDPTAHPTACENFRLVDSLRNNKPQE